MRIAKCLCCIVPLASICTPSAPAADRTLVVSGVVEAPADDLFAAFTTPEGIVKAWGVAQARVDFRVGGQIRTAYQPDVDLDSPRTIVNTILAYEPGRMLALKSAAPEGAPDWLKAFCDRGWWVIRLEPLGPARTRYTETGMGFAEGPLFDQAYEFFRQGNEATLRHMQQAFAPSGASAPGRPLAVFENMLGEWVSEGTPPGAMLARTSWRRIHGGFIAIDGWLGDENGMRPHALLVAGIDPAAGGAAFWNFGDRGDVARGHIVLAGENSVAFDWVIDAIGRDGTPTRTPYHVVITLQAKDAYRTEMWRGGPPAPGTAPDVALSYRRVAEVPEKFRRTVQEAR